MVLSSTLQYRAVIAFYLFSAIFVASLSTHAAETTVHYTSVTRDYAVPEVTLINAEGKSVQLANLLAQPRPVLLQFVFTSCSTICPLLSITFSEAQADLNKFNPDYQMLSISIDPEYDTTERLAAYAQRFHAGHNWNFLSGRRQDIVKVLHAFNALYQGDNKMYHQPLYFLRAAPDKPWHRLEGFVNVADLLKDYRSALDETKTAN